MDINTLKKRELHCHLCGAITLETVKELCFINNLEFTDIDKTLFVNKPVSSMLEYFQPWSILKELPKSKLCIEKMVYSALKSFKKFNIEYAELRYSPITFMNAAGIGIDEAIDWLTYAVQKYESYTNIKARLILTMSRFNFNYQFGLKMLKSIGRVNSGGTIVGIDLVGDEGCKVPEEIGKLFKHAKDNYGLGITIHAGETGILENIEWAIDKCDANRIGHGLAAAKSEKLLEKLAKNDICIEVCLKSNYLTGNVKDIYSHPVKKFIEFGVPFVLCTDNPSIQQFSLSDEYKLFLEITNREDIIKNMISVQRKYSFG